MKAEEALGVASKKISEVDNKLNNAIIGGGGTLVEASSTNGNIKINNVEKTVYTHPNTHDASFITESTDKRFVSDTEKTLWNGKTTTSVNNSPQNVNLTLSPSGETVESVNGKKFASNTDIVTDRGSILQSRINRVFYKNMCKEFTSDGSAITVNNGMDGYVLSGMIQGQTVKNLCPSVIRENVNTIKWEYVTVENNVITLNAQETQFDVDINNVSGNLVPNKQYILKYWVYSNTLTSEFELNSGTSSIGAFSTQIKVPVGFTGVKEVAVTAKSDLSNATRFIRTYIPPTQSGSISYSVVLFDVGTKTSDKIVPFGLSSNQATVYNNQTNYSFVKDGAVIELGGTATKKDTLELKEDGSAVYTQNTQNNADGSARIDLATPVVTTIPKELCPTILTQLSNTFSFGDAVKPSKVTISVPVNKIADLETRLAQLEAVVTSTSNLSSLANYVDDEYNNSLNQM